MLHVEFLNHTQVPAMFLPMQTLCTVRAGLLVAALTLSALSRAAAAPATGMSASATPVASLKVAKDFKVELLYTVPKGVEGSWVAMCVDWNNPVFSRH